MLRKLCVFGAMLTLASCTSYYRTEGVQDAGCHWAYRRGSPVATLTSNDVTVCCELQPQLSNKERIELQLIVKNISNQPVDFDPAMIWATIDGQSLRPFTVVELVAEVESRDYWGSWGESFSTFLRRMEADEACRKSKKRLAGDSKKVEWKEVSHDGVAAYQTKREIEKEATAVRDQRRQMAEQAKVSITEQVLQRTTLQPGESVVGSVIFESMPTAVGSQGLLQLHFAPPINRSCTFKLSRT